MAGFKFQDDEEVVPEPPAKPAAKAAESPAAAKPPAVVPPTPAVPTPTPPRPVAPGTSARPAPGGVTPQAPTPQVPQAARPVAPTAPTPARPTVPTPTAPNARPTSPQGAAPQATPQAPTTPGQPRVPQPGAAPTGPMQARPAAPAAPAPRPTVPSPVIPSPVAPTGAAPKVGAAPANPVVPTAPARPAGAPGTTPPTRSAPAAPSLPTSQMAPQPNPGGMPATGELARAMLTTHEREHVDKKAPVWRQALDMLDPYATIAFRIALPITGISLLYLLYAVFGGNIGQLNGTNEVARASIHNLQLASTVFNCGIILIGISLMILMFDEGKIEIALIILGLAFHFGIPFYLASSVGRSNATSVMAGVFRSGGFILTVLGLCKYSIDLMRWLADLPDRVKSRADVGSAERAEIAQQRVARNANMFSPCWSLPYCREVIRKQCPAYIAKKRCWKFGRGCYCDEEMIARIIRGESMDVIKAPTRLSRQGKPPCGRCYIYLEHQTLKFRSMSWLGIPGTVVTMFAIWPLYTKIWQTLTGSMDKFWAGLSFSAYNYAPGAVKTDPANVASASQVNQAQVEAFGQTLFGVILGFMVLIYLSKFIEWAIFKAKL